MGCAKELILEHGVDGVSMDDIAAKAELSKGTLYLYFTGKDELFSAICEEAAAKFCKYVESRLEGGISGLEALKRYWVSYLETFGTSDDLFILFSMRQFLAPENSFIALFEKDEYNESAGAASYVFYHLLKKMIDQGKEEGTFDADTDAGLVTNTIIALFSSAVENAARLPRTARKSAPVIDELKRVFEIILRGIARDGIARSSLILPDAGETGRSRRKRIDKRNRKWKNF
jgi:AcrR family transcriptional regulator